MYIKGLSIITVVSLLLCIYFIYPKNKKQVVVDNQCYTCHIDLGGKQAAPAKAYEKDIHFLKGITCASCHGGDARSDDMDVAMSKEKGFIGVPKPQDRYKVCVNCHADENVMKKYKSSLPTDQYKKLQLSVHYKQSADSKGLIADCITCHSVHDIASVKSPESKVYPTKIPALCGSCHSNANFMKKYNPKLPIDQVEKYLTSVHGQLNQKGDINTAECVNCHGNHEIRHVKDPKSPVYVLNMPKVCSNCHSNTAKMAKYHIPTNQFELYANSVHGIALLKKQDLSAPSCNSCHGNHGAVPPGVESISNVCGTCHTLNADLFSKSPHKDAFDQKNIPECETCHGNHGIQTATNKLIGVDNQATCTKCHFNNPNDKGYFAAKMMRQLIDSLSNDEKSSKKVLNEANALGMDVSESMYSIKDIKQVLIQTRTIIHLSDLKQFKDNIQGGFDITTKAKAAGKDAIDEYYFRRKGLGIATIIVTLLAVGLYLKIRKIDKKPAK